MEYRSGFFLNYKSFLLIERQNLSYIVWLMPKDVSAGRDSMSDKAQY